MPQLSVINLRQHAGQSHSGSRQTHRHVRHASAVTLRIYIEAHRAAVHSSQRSDVHVSSQSNFLEGYMRCRVLWGLRRMISRGQQRVLAGAWGAHNREPAACSSAVPGTRHSSSIASWPWPQPMRRAASSSAYCRPRQPRVPIPFPRGIQHDRAPAHQQDSLAPVKRSANVLRSASQCTSGSAPWQLLADWQTGSMQNTCRPTARERRGMSWALGRCVCCLLGGSYMCLLVLWTSLV